MTKKNKKDHEDTETEDVEEENSDEELEDEEEESEEEESDEDEGDSGEDDGDESSEDDLAAQLKIETDRRKKAEAKLAGKAFNKRQSKREEGADEDESDDSDEDDDDKPMTRREARKFLAATQKATQLAEVNRIAGSITANTTEASLVAATWQNREYPSDLSLHEQVEEAKAVALRKRNAATSKELARALNGKKGVSKTAAGGSGSGAQKTMPKMEKGFSAALVAQGYKYNSNKGLYMKSISPKKAMVYDPKTKKRWVMPV